MTLNIHPDPQEPAGGYAFLELPGGSLPDGSIAVAVQEVFGDRWLAPDDGWRGQRHDFGPYKVHRHQGADWVRIGPEIVDRVEEYTSLRIVVDGKAHDVTWPDDVPPRASAAAAGGIQAHPRQTAPQPAPKPVAPPIRMPEPEPVEAEPEHEEKRRSPWFPLLLVLLLLAALVAAWLFFHSEGTPPEEPEPRAETDTCTFAALSALSGGFETVAQAIRDCGADVSAETALRLIEDASAKGDAGALLLFGTLYDGQELDPRIENLTGLTFDDDPAKAAYYYAMAAKAGSGPAKLRLSATCTRLAGRTETLAKGAHDDFCR